MISLSKVRLFWGISLPPNLRGSLHGLQKNLPWDREVKWVNKENLHITLNFLGAQPKKSLGQICSGADKISEHFHPFEISLEGIGRFPPKGKPRIIWAGVNKGDCKLQKIHAMISSEMQRDDQANCRRVYIPHVTLGRIRPYAISAFEMDNLLKQSEKIFLGEFINLKLSLFKSDLTSTGPKYTILHQSFLRGAQ
jgi:2'-5' RNA ligase